MWLIHLAVQVFGSAPEGLFLAEVVVDFSSQGDVAVVQTGLYKEENKENSSVWYNYTFSKKIKD